MFKRALLAGLCSAALAFAPAEAAITFVNNTGQYVIGSNVTTAPLIVSNAVTAGDLILITGAWGASSAWTAVDSSGNTYNLVASNCTWNTNHHLLMFWATATTGLAAPVTATGAIGPASTTVTFTTNPGTLAVNQVITGTGVTVDTYITGGISQWNGTTASATVNNSQTAASTTLTISSGIRFSWTTGSKLSLSAAEFAGGAASPLDITGACVSGNGTNATISTGTLAQAAEVVIGVEATTASQTIGTTATGFTALTAAGTNLGNDEVHWAYQIVSSTSTVTYNQSWTTTRQFVGNVWTYKASTGAAVAPSNLPLLGVGK